jgi:hypothetical protein
MAGLVRYPWLSPWVRVWIPCLVWLVAPQVGVAAAEAPLATEPGIVAADGTWLLPISVSGGRAAEDFDSAEVTAWRDDRQLAITERLAYSLHGGSAETALAILLDVPTLDEQLAATWSVDIARTLDRAASPGVWSTLARSGPDAVVPAKPGDCPLAAGAVRQILVDPVPGRLWDIVFDAITVLDAPDLPERRVLLLVSDGREETPSRLVVATCVEAALRARVAVYVLSLAGGGQAEADGARLRELVRRTGGRLLTLGDDPEHALVRILDLIGGARGLRFAADGGALPATISVRGEGQPSVQLIGEIAQRRRLGVTVVKPWLLGGLALLLAGGAGFLLWWQRPLRYGDLMVSTRNGVRRFPIARHGVTIGRDEDNNMVLASPMVSGHHAVVRVKDGAVVLTDLRSSRGTAVNGQSIGTCELKPGDRILLGGAVELVFRIRPPAV